MLKKFDFYAQITIAGVAIILAVASLFQSTYFFFSLLLLLPLGIWQLISAACYSFGTGSSINKPILKKYWVWSTACLIIFFISFFLRDNEGNEASFTLMTAAVTGCFTAALYYLYLYKKYFLHAKPAEENSCTGGIG